MEGSDGGLGLELCDNWYVAPRIAVGGVLCAVHAVCVGACVGVDVGAWVRVLHMLCVLCVMSV
jgi:hypothetical protein